MTIPEASRPRMGQAVHGESLLPDPGARISCITHEQDRGIVAGKEADAGALGRQAIFPAGDQAAGGKLLDEVQPVCQRDQCLTDRSVAMRVKLHAVAGNIGDLDKLAIIVFVEGVEHADARTAWGRTRLACCSPGYKLQTDNSTMVQAHAKMLIQILLDPAIGGSASAPE